MCEAGGRTDGETDVAQNTKKIRHSTSPHKKTKNFSVTNERYDLRSFTKANKGLPILSKSTHVQYMVHKRIWAWADIFLRAGLFFLSNDGRCVIDSSWWLFVLFFFLNFLFHFHSEGFSRHWLYYHHYINNIWASLYFLKYMLFI